MTPLTAFAPHKGTAGATDHLDAIYILKQIVLSIPKDTGIQRRVHSASIDHHQQFVGEIGIEPSRADTPIVGIFLCDLQVIRQPQRLGNAGGPRATDVILGDDLDSRGGGDEFLGMARHRGDFDIQEIVDR